MWKEKISQNEKKEVKRAEWRKIGSWKLSQQDFRQRGGGRRTKEQIKKNKSKKEKKLLIELWEQSWRHALTRSSLFRFVINTNIVKQKAWAHTREKSLQEKSCVCVCVYVIIYVVNGLD